MVSVTCCSKNQIVNKYYDNVTFQILQTLSPHALKKAEYLLLFMYIKTNQLSYISICE